MNVAVARRPALGSGVREAAILLAALGLCPLAALLIGDDAAAPLARAEALVAAEQALGIHVEPAVHGWARGHGWLLTGASVFYVGAHVPVAGWALVWTWYLRRDRFAAVRDLFLATQALLVALYVLVPTAPPRLLPGGAFTDTLGGLWGRGLADSAHTLQSPYAAVPSGHVAFALIAGATFARLGDRGWLRAFGWSYPLLVVTVTVVTANHLLLDAVAAVLVVAVAGWLVTARGAGSRHAWCGRAR
jgi:hypothetical protein